MSNSEHQRPSVVEELRLRCSDRLGELALTRWRWVGLVLLVAAVLAAVALATSRPDLSDTPSTGTVVSHAAVTVSVPADAPAGGLDSDVMVQVVGAVAKPGVYRLAATARIVDAVEMAGGLAADADAERVNLAAKLVDGQSIYIARLGQALVPQSSASSPTDDRAADGPVDINTASAEQLEKLPGVGPATAKAIVDHRTKNGAFKSVDDLGKVRGIGPSKLDQLRDSARV